MSMLDTIDQELALLVAQQPDIDRLTNAPIPADPAFAEDTGPVEEEPQAAPPAPQPALSVDNRDEAAEGETSPAADENVAEEQDGGEGPAGGTRWPLWLLLGVSVIGAAVVGTIGFAGSYDAVRALAIDHGIRPGIAKWVPIGVDAGIIVFLALALALAMLRLQAPLLRPAAHLLTVLTIAFNAAGSWGTVTASGETAYTLVPNDPVGVGLHGILPILFVVAVESAQHAVAQLAGIAAGENMDRIRRSAWLLSPWKTFRLWREMVLCEVVSYRQALVLREQRTTLAALIEDRYPKADDVPVALRIRLARTRLMVPVDAPLPDLDELLARSSGSVADVVTWAAAQPTGAADDTPPAHPRTTVHTTRSSRTGAVADDTGDSVVGAANVKVSVSKPPRPTTPRKRVPVSPAKDGRSVVSTVVGDTARAASNDPEAARAERAAAATKFRSALALDPSLTVTGYAENVLGRSRSWLSQALTETRTDDSAPGSDR
ncbi:MULTISPECIES: DUF2637 domain-containing protein [unclassified Streptomyces]|uniref:DUF2637 domain-containing protein n=1 Tax=unclassified Streptomyces TaxID=2593676 RepID=UPI00226F9B26|nr:MULTISPECIES: DUF2637 domain-containing protein [unclassified Streptomyces]MCY0923574.1 DUF2637 domain-containing protein [Streptomyces sp. H27-G5]MCY0962023.1 DUF2637 domain-containing protein [Streptomyces sp. H27-H5]